MKRKSVLAGILGAIIFFLSGCDYQAVAGSEYQDPVIPHYTDETGPVIDSTGTVSSEWMRVFREEVIAFNNAGDEQLVVGIFNNLASDEVLFATEIGNQNGIGEAATDNGMVIAIFLEKEGAGGAKPAIGFATGSGIEGVLNDAKIGRLLDATYVPLRAENNWQQGLVDFIRATRQVLDGGNIDDFQPPPPDYTWLIWVVIVIVVVLILASLDFKYNDGVFVAAVADVAVKSIGKGGGFSGGGAKR